MWLNSSTLPLLEPSGNFYHSHCCWSQTDVIKKGSTTHVVSTSVLNIQGSMEAVIKKILYFNVDGKVEQAER